MQTVSNSAAESNFHAAMEAAFEGIQIEADWLEEQAAFEREMAADASRCRACGLESSGNVLAGVQVPLCDSCLVDAAVTLAGLPLALSVVNRTVLTEGEDWADVQAETAELRTNVRRCGIRAVA